MLFKGNNSQIRNNLFDKLNLHFCANQKLIISVYGQDDVILSCGDNQLCAHD